MSKLFLGIDLGGTNIKAGIFNENMDLIKKGSSATNPEKGAAAVVDNIGDLAEHIIADAGNSMDDIIAIGIGSPGPVNLREGIVVAAPNIPAFRNTPLRKMVRKRLGKPTVMENDANAACWGEHVIGAGKGVDNMIFFTLGTGIGGGIISNGEIVHGYADDAAELGHIIIYPDGRLCACGQRGCVEAYASANSTVSRAIDAVRDGKQSSLTKLLDENGTITCKDIYDAAASSDQLAVSITDGTARALGLLCVGLLHTTGPRRIVFAGGMIAAGKPLLNKIQHYFDMYIWPMKEEALEICFATLGADAGIIGNAALAQNAINKGQLS